MVAEYLKSLLPAEWPLFTGDLPATRKEAIGVIEYDGAMSTEYFGMQQDSSIFNPIVKFVIRSNTYSQGKTWADSIKKTLHRFHDETLLSVLIVGTPIYLGRSVDKLHEFQVTFKIETKE